MNTTAPAVTSPDMLRENEEMYKFENKAKTELNVESKISQYQQGASSLHLLRSKGRRAEQVEISTNNIRKSIHRNCISEF